MVAKRFIAINAPANSGYSPEVCVVFAIVELDAILLSSSVDLSTGTNKPHLEAELCFFKTNRPLLHSAILSSSESSNI